MPTIDDTPKARAPLPKPQNLAVQSNPLKLPYHASARKRWGLDNDSDGTYWFNPQIHTLGNIGFLGAIHAALAPLSTKLIDIVAYDGQDVRQMVSYFVCFRRQLPVCES